MGSNVEAAAVRTPSRATAGGRRNYRGPGGPSGVPGGNSGSGDGAAPWYLARSASGNDVCHCHHVEQLIADATNLKGDMDSVKATAEAVRVGGGLGTGIGGRPPAPPERLPLVIGPLGQLEPSSSRLFDDRLTA